MAKLFFKPDRAFAADFIPLYAEGAYYLYYLHDWRDAEDRGEGVPWYVVRTRDFVHFEELGEALPRGGADRQDMYVFTGSALRAMGRYHIFYTGHNPRFPALGKPMEGVMHAVSDNLVDWRKLDEAPLYAPRDGFEPDDWRDPFVYLDEASGRYQMLLAARKKEGASRRRGLTARMSSDDLRSWRLETPMWEPNLYYTHECPDRFVENGWEYLVFSEFSQESCTRYVMRRAGESLWRAPANDRFDGRAYYAAKTASDGEKRYVFGWLPTRTGNRDDGDWNWGGCLVTHEVVFHPDGSLGVREPQGVRDAFSVPVPLPFSAGALEGVGGWAQLPLGELPDVCRVEVALSWEDGAREIGLAFRSDEAIERCHEIRIEPQRHRMVADRWPRPGDRPYHIGLERPVGDTDEHVLTVLLDGTAGCAYLDGEVALCFRAYERFGAHAALLTRNANARVRSVRAYRREQ